jgi:hypothetical protein
MKHLIWTLAVTASLAAPLPAAGQHAVPRGGGGGGSSSSGGGGGSSSGGGGGSSSSGGGSSSSDGGSSWAPPRHPGGSSSSSGRGRSGGDGGGSTAGSRRSPGGSSSSGSDSDRVVGGTSGRTRDGRPITGYAVPRGTVVPSGQPGGDYYFYPRGRDWYYSPWYYSRYSPYYFSGFGASMWGLGYIWDPFWFGPGYGFADPWGFGHDPGYGYGGGGGYAAGGDPDEIEGQGGLRIKVKPREAKVLVDGTFAGTVDDFDGNFQKLRLDEGAHKVELQADGFEPLRFDVLIVEGQTVTYKGQLRQR